MSALAVSPPGVYQLVPHLSLGVTTTCVGSVTIADSALSESPLGGNSVVYPAEAISFGAQCSGDDPLAVFLPAIEALAVEEIRDARAAILKVEGIGSLLSTVLTLAEAIAFAFLGPATCGDFSAKAYAPIGVLHQSDEDFELLGTSLPTGQKYFHYAKLNDKDELEAFCTYTDKELPTITEGNPGIAGEYKQAEGVTFDTCLDSLDLMANASSPDNGQSWVLRSDSVKMNGNQCDNGGAIVVSPYSRINESPELSSLLSRLDETTEGKQFLVLLDRFSDELGDALWAFVRSGTIGCGTEKVQGFGFGIFFEAPKTGRVVLISATKGLQYFLASAIDETGKTISQCVYEETKSGGDSGGGSGEGSSTSTPEASPTPTPEASPSPTEDTTPVATDAPCFPASSRVLLSDSSHKRLDELEIGDRVQVGPKEYSDIFFFGHRSNDEEAEFVELLTTAGSAISISGSHYLYCNSRLTAASKVEVGDSVTLGDGSGSVVVRKSVIKKQGLFAPHTLHGDIVVDGVRASCYTTVVHPKLAHALLTPLRVLYALGFPAVRVFEKVSRVGLARALRLPQGPATLAA